MIWFLFIPVIAYFTFTGMYSEYFWGYDNHKDFLEWCGYIFFSSFFTFLISLVPLIIAAIIGSNSKRKGVKAKEYTLVALREHSGIKGNFFLGSGYVGDKQYYFWYRKNSDGSISGGKTERVPDVRIFEQTDSPKMVEFKSEYVNKRWQKYSWIFGFDVRGDDGWKPDFYIPKGSIKEGYSL